MDLLVTGFVRAAVERKDVTQTLVNDAATRDLSQPIDEPAGLHLGSRRPLSR